MHKKKKGKSGSTKPLRSEAKKWLKYSKEEVEKLVVKLGKQESKPALIGATLRDVYGIANVKDACGKTVTQILDENKLSKKVPSDMLALMTRSVNLREHLGKNKKDVHSKRGLILIDSKIKRLAKYYTRVGKLPQYWKYDPEEAKILIE